MFAEFISGRAGNIITSDTYTKLVFLGSRSGAERRCWEDMMISRLCILWQTLSEGQSVTMEDRWKKEHEEWMRRKPPYLWLLTYLEHSKYLEYLKSKDWSVLYLVSIRSQAQAQRSIYICLACVASLSTSQGRALRCGWFGTLLKASIFRVFLLSFFNRLQFVASPNRATSHVVALALPSVYTHRLC